MEAPEPEPAEVVPLHAMAEPPRSRQFGEPLE